MTDKERMMKLTAKIRKEADQVHVLKHADDVAALTTNMLFAIAHAMLQHHGWYSCTIGTKKTLFVVEG